MAVTGFAAIAAGTWSLAGGAVALIVCGALLLSAASLGALRASSKRKK